MCRLEVEGSGKADNFEHSLLYDKSENIIILTLIHFYLCTKYIRRPYNTSKVNDSFGSSAIFSEMIRTIIELFKIIIISCYTIEIGFLIEIKSPLERLLSTMN